MILDFYYKYYVIIVLIFDFWFSLVWKIFLKSLNFEDIEIERKRYVFLRGL